MICKPCEQGDHSECDLEFPRVNPNAGLMDESAALAAESIPVCACENAFHVFYPDDLATPANGSIDG